MNLLERGDYTGNRLRFFWKHPKVAEPMWERWEGERWWKEERECVSKCTCVLIFGCTSSKPLIILVKNLMAYISGPPVNHIVDGSH
jgi:hypothetical protein